MLVEVNHLLQLLVGDFDAVVDFVNHEAVSFGITSGYGPRKRSPLKWIMWSGSSAIQTSDS
jgi:hypothetical protein